MTLGEMAEQVCGVVGMTDDESVLACKGFLQRRYKTIWDARLWRETVIVLPAPSQYAPVTAGQQDIVFTGAPGIERILQICANDETRLEPVEWTSRWLTEPGAFAAAAGGSVLSFSLQRKSAALISPDALDNDVLGIDIAGWEDGKTISIEGLLEDGAHYDRTWTAPNGLTPGIAPTFPPAATILSTGLTFREIWSIRANMNTLGTGLYLANGAGAGAISPGSLASQLYPAVRLWNPAPANTFLRVLGKLACPRLTLDDSIPLLPHIDEALIAAAQADMLERQRQYAKASAKRAESAGFVQQMVDIARQQTADALQIIPWVEPAATVSSGFSSKSHW